ncbi:pyrroline-5-carboxylate reductase [Miniphocaeibacter massiliensis]|uniref:pyrroline-5-carboxylate reductase n=1 Tax=Miniphocaeibacter massiliensis TaxID=2041841 RepID=UPI000C1BBDA5|nr:pyrroline-5-carboxylate reductase [Miniphocaeibacter massiliensis]
MDKENKIYKLGFIGCGNMGKAMLSGALENGYVKRDEVIIYTQNKENLNKLETEFGIVKANNNKEVAKSANIIILGVKPNIYKEIIEEIKNEVDVDTIITSITPSFKIEELQSFFEKDVKIARAMPNTPAMVGAGISGLCFSGNLNKEEIEKVYEFFKSFGEVVVVKEELMKAVVSVSGSGPAYIYLLIEAMADAGVAEGLSRKDAYIFVAKTVEGAAKMVLQTGKHPGELKDDVCSPAGTTIAGVNELEKNGFRGTIIKGIEKTAEKFEDMNKI